jgi:alpha/beta superfamily hydrolase
VAVAPCRPAAGPRWFTDTFVLTPESLRIAYKRVTFVTEDGVTLEGWYLEQTVRGRPSERVVLCCNPYMKDKSTLLAVARALWDTGHSVLLFDFRAFAPEQARHETIGHLELRDGRAALAWLRANKPPKAKIGVMGCSMGGAVALSLACEDDTDVVGVATDCAFASLKDVITHYFELKVTPHAPAVAVNAFVDALCAWNKMWSVCCRRRKRAAAGLTWCARGWHRYGYDPADVGPLHKLDRLRVPMLLIHSNNDSVVPLEQAHIIHERAATPPELKKLYVVPNVEHIGYFFSDEIAYSACRSDVRARVRVD